MADLGVGGAGDINESGEILDSFGVRAPGGDHTALAPFGSFHAAAAINDLGQVVGSGELPRSKNSTYPIRRHPLLWNPPAPTLPSVSVGSTSVAEGDTGKGRVITFPVTLSEPSTAPVSVSYAIVADGSASPGSDVVLRTGTVNFKLNAKGITPVRQVITAKVAADIDPEGDETFHVVLTNPTAGYHIGHGTGTGTLLDDDPSADYRVSIGDSSGWEGDAGTGNSAKVWVTLSRPATSPVSVRVSISPTDATAGVDYKAKGKVITFATGDVKKAVNVNIYPDALTEGDEHVQFTLTEATGDGLVIDRAVGTLTILDDD